MVNDGTDTGPAKDGEDEIEMVRCVDLTGEKGLIGWYMRVDLSMDEAVGMFPSLKGTDIARVVAFLYRVTLAFVLVGWSLYFLGFRSYSLYLPLFITLMVIDGVVGFIARSRLRAATAEVDEMFILEYKRIEASSIVLSMIVCVGFSILLLWSAELPEVLPYEPPKIQSAPQ